MIKVTQSRPASPAIRPITATLLHASLKKFQGCLTRSTCTVRFNGANRLPLFVFCTAACLFQWHATKSEKALENSLRRQPLLFTIVWVLIVMYGWMGMLTDVRADLTEKFLRAKNIRDKWCCSQTRFDWKPNLDEFQRKKEKIQTSASRG